MADPARPPALHSAWKLLMIGRPYRRSTVDACAFIATSSVPWTDAERHQREHERDRVRGERRQEQRRAKNRRAHARHRTAAVARHEMPRPRHGQERPHRDAEQRDAQCAFAEPELRLHRRDADEPVRGGCTVDEEDRRDRRSRQPQLAFDPGVA
jgi:hypothetical protein